MKLRTKILVAFLLVSVLPLTAIVLYTYFSSLESLRMAALSEVAALTAEIGDRMAAVRRDMNTGIELLGSRGFGQVLSESGEESEGLPLLSDLESAMGTATPYLESLEFIPMPRESAPEAPLPPSPENPRPAAPAAGLLAGVESVVIHVGDLVEGSLAAVGAGEGQTPPEGERRVMAEIELRSRVELEDLEARLADLDTDRLMAQARELEEEAKRIAAESREHRRELEDSRREERSRVLWLEPREVDGSTTVWRPDVLEEKQLEELKAREQEQQRILGREFQSVVERQGREVGRLKARVSARKLLHQVLAQTQRQEGEIAYAVDGEGRVYVAREEDRQQLEGLPLKADDALAAGSQRELDDWVIVRLQDADSDLVYGIARPIGEGLTDLRRTAGRNFAIGLGLIGLALAGIVPLSSRITRDLNRLAAGAERMATGDLDVRVDVRSRDEVGHLASTLNQMAGDLQQHQQKLLEEERLRKENEVQHRLLAAENSRKSDELEAARRFQLSLLPKRIPEHPQLDIGVFMRTATEVGGDYYDFCLVDDGSLTVAVGDATGHGARAGTMVTVIKSLFAAEAGELGLAAFLDKASRSIRRMELGRMAMALTLVRYRQGRLTLAAAGMPPALIHRAADGAVEEVTVTGMPLGAMSSTSYAEREVEVAAGDTILLMTDGFPELVGAEGEPMGYAAVRSLFAGSADRPPAALIDVLSEAAAAWSAQSSPSDDITFVVIRVKD